jgi:hypothetical protein
MKKIDSIMHRIILFVLSALISISAFSQNKNSILDRYNVIWSTPSHNSSESMPVGGCDMGCNVWIENGSLYLYAGRSGNFDENNALLKLGRIKITFSPNFLIGATQKLVLKNGLIEIKGSIDNKPFSGRIWVESNEPVAHIEFSGSKTFTANVEYQSWRTEKKKISSRWVVPTYIDYPGKVFWYPDVVKTTDNRITFYHQNNNNDLAIDKEIEQQGLSNISDKLWNPLRNFVFGGLVEGENLVSSGHKTGTYLNTPYTSYCLISAKPSNKFRLDIFGHSGYYKTTTEYETALFQSYQNKTDLSKPYKEHQKYWNDFWDRSYIILNGDRNDPKDSIWQVGRNYNLFRFQLGCNAKGEYPTKFNGGLFTFDPVTISKDFVNDNPDFRAWGGGVMTAQNQRLLYWPLLKSGDTDIMPQECDFYRRALNNSELKVKQYWGHGGCCFVDQMNQAGIPCGREYGWNRPKDFDPTTQYSQWHQYYFTSQLEFSYMVLEYYRFTGKDISEYMPFVKASIQFFDEHYRYLSKKYFGTEFTKDGKYNFYPCQALETYSGIVKNPSDVIAALMRLTTEMQDLPYNYVNKTEKDFYKQMASRLPAISTRIMKGHQTISPAESWEKIINVEIPQLYPVFPWGIFGLTKPNLNMAIDTWKYGVDTAPQKNYISWHQDAIFCARMGLVDEAAKITIQKLKDSDRRYPTFWGPGHDWAPDHNWGGSGMIGLQEMLLQTPGKDILLFPAWPKKWDVDFKLRAPYNTIIEGSYKNGKLIKLKVLPEARRKDLKVLLNK